MRFVLEDSTLQPSRSLVLKKPSPPATPTDLRSSLTLSIHLFFGLPRVLLPCTSPWSAIFGSRCDCVITCPNYFKRFSAIRCTTSACMFVLTLTSSLLFQSLLVTPMILIRHPISNTLNLYFVISMISYYESIYLLFELIEIVSLLIHSLFQI